MKKILIIDDQKDNLISIEAVIGINITNCKVLTALSGKQGIKLAKEEQPDTILLDIIMPEMDGYEVCKQLKEDLSTKHIPIILISAAKIDSKSRVNGLISGADAFLSKPIDTDEFVAQVNTMLRIKKAEDKLRNETEKLRKTLETYHVKLESEIESRISTETLLEHRYQQIYQFSPDSIIIHDMDMNILDANNKATEEFGYSLEELLAKKIFELHPESELNHSAQVLASMKKKKMLTVETKFVRKDGSVFSAEITPCKYMLGNKEIIHIVIRDITERKQAEEQIKAKSLFLESLIQQLPLPTFVMDSKGFNVMVNEAFLKFYAVPDKDMVLGRNALTEPANVSHGVVKYFKEALSGKIVEMPELEFVSPYENKKVITRCKLFPILDPTGTLTNVVVMQEDITERKQVERALKDSEQNYRVLFDNISDGIFVLDAETMKVVIANKAIAKIYGFDSEDDITNLNPIDLILPEDKEAVYKIIAEDMFENNLQQTNEFRSLTKDGREIWISAIGVKTEYQGRLAGLISIRGITELKNYSNIGFEKFIKIPARGKPNSSITPEIHNALEQKLNDSLNPLKGYWHAIFWLNETMNVNVTYQALRNYMIKHFKTKLKVPRKSHYKKDEQAIEAFFKTAECTEAI